MSRHFHVGRIWVTSCKICAKSITQHGSGRPKTNCGIHKKLIKKRIYQSQTEIRENAMRQRKRIVAKDHAFVRLEKIRVGRCAMHPFIFDGQELLVTERNAVAFCWDHVDRATKTMSISEMIGRGGEYNEQNLKDEMAKCVLMCANCHQIKTYEQNDYRQIDRVITESNQPTLFDN